MSASAGGALQRVSFTTRDFASAGDSTLFSRAFRCEDVDGDGFTDVAARTISQALFLKGTSVGLSSTAVGPIAVPSSAGTSTLGSIAIGAADPMIGPWKRVFVAALAPDGRSESFVEFRGAVFHAAPSSALARPPLFQFDSIAGTDDDDRDGFSDFVVAQQEVGINRLVLVRSTAGRSVLETPPAFDTTVARIVSR